MKKMKVMFLLATFVIGLAASSCRTHQSCPAYGSAHKAKHRAI